LKKNRFFSKNGFIQLRIS